MNFSFCTGVSYVLVPAPGFVTLSRNMNGLETKNKNVIIEEGNIHNYKEVQ